MINNEKENINYASFAKRSIATQIDIAVLYLLFLLIYFIYNGSFENYFNKHGMFDLTDIAFELTSIILSILLLVKYKATPGKMIMKVEVIDVNSLTNITPKQGIIRNIGYYISMIPFGLGYIWIFFDKKNQSWQDKLSKSIVIDLNYKKPSLIKKNCI